MVVLFKLILSISVLGFCHTSQIVTVAFLECLAFMLLFIIKRLFLKIIGQRLLRPYRLIVGHLKIIIIDALEVLSYSHLTVSSGFFDMEPLLLQLLKKLDV